MRELPELPAGASLEQLVVALLAEARHECGKLYRLDDRGFAKVEVDICGVMVPTVNRGIADCIDHLAGLQGQSGMLLARALERLGAPVPTG